MLICLGDILSYGVDTIKLFKQLEIELEKNTFLIKEIMTKYMMIYLLVKPNIDGLPDWLKNRFTLLLKD